MIINLDTFGNALDIRRANVSVPAGQTDYSIVAAVAGKKIVPLMILLSCGGTATQLSFLTKGSGAGTSIAGIISQAINQFTSLPFCPVGLFETNIGEALTANTGAGAATGVTILYALI